MQAARRAEEERREAARREALARAEAEQAERARWLQARSRHKETQLGARSRELAELRALHQRQRQMRAEYARWVCRGGVCVQARGIASRRAMNPWCLLCRGQTQCSLLVTRAVKPLLLEGTGWNGTRHSIALTREPSHSTPAPTANTHTLPRHLPAGPLPFPGPRHRQELAAQREEERRQQLTSRLAAKQRRVAAMEEEKAAMLRALEEVRREIRQQEDGLK